MPPQSGLDISPITDWLYISAWPSSKNVEEIYAMNIGLILSMHWIRPTPRLGHPPVRLLWLPTFDNPLLPMPIPTFQMGVEAALPVIRDGQAVMVHCRAGVHRSVAMACCVLIGMGETADDAMQIVRQKRDVADPYARHIKRRIYKFEQHWLARSAGQSTVDSQAR